ncbi:unnamed protein product [Rhizoctonia solani]|uniref:Oxidoreductase AflY n=1 Tax=Rhizoctonia solani TaxID=456999 RepID=A0A8H3E176_9AGAM|nr:unnamed protein product [Rhizoctonia solani]
MVPPDFDDAVLERLFPVPTLSGITTGPDVTLSAGITPESTAELRRLMVESHKRFHGFFVPKGYESHHNHNHILHHLLATYVLGATPQVLQAKFDYHARFLQAAYKSPGPITRSNWRDHLGDEDYYNAYINFFTAEIQARGLSETFTSYIMVPEGNWGEDEPRMVDRFLAGIIHPLIHFGHALEYGIEGMAVEGLVWTAVHPTENQNLLNEEFFTAPQTKEHTHALTILARMLVDERLEPGRTCARSSLFKYTDTVESAGPIIRDYARLWRIREDEQEIQERVEELTADTFTAHLVTSNHFLQLILPLLNTAHKVELLRAYFAVVLVYYACRGRQRFDFYNFFQPPVATPWNDLLAGSVSQQDEHFVKAERALARSAELYGHRPKGVFKHTELLGAEEIDGSLFVKTGKMLSGVSRFGMAWRRA